MEGIYALLAFLVAFLIAQLWKTVEGMVSRRGATKKMTLKEMIGYFARSGGMPSGHAASFTALTWYLGLSVGFASQIFALAVATWAIILYDATHVRYAVGEQGKALNEVLSKEGKSELPVVEGHTLGQVAAGVVIGLLVGGGFYWLTNLR